MMRRTVRDIPLTAPEEGELLLQLSLSRFDEQSSHGSSHFNAAIPAPAIYRKDVIR